MFKICFFIFLIITLFLNLQRKSNTNSKLFKTIIMKIKTYLFSVVSICMLFNLTSCNSDVANNVQEETIASEKLNVDLECNNFSKTLRGISVELNRDTAYLNRLFDYDFAMITRSNYTIKEGDAEKSEQILKNIRIQSEKLLEAFEVKDLTQLTEDEKLSLSILLYADYMDNHNISATRGPISETKIFDCAKKALGITGVSNVIKKGIVGFAKEYGGKAVLQLVAKTAGKAVSAVGMVMAAYDFADCMDWI